MYLLSRSFNRSIDLASGEHDRRLQRIAAKQPTQHIRTFSLMYWMISVVLVLFGATIYTVTFAQSVYPDIPEQLGEGQPRPIELLIDATQINSVSQLQVPIVEGQQLTEVVDLIWQGDQGYLVHYEVEGEDRVVLIDRDLVDAIILD